MSQRGGGSNNNNNNNNNSNNFHDDDEDTFEQIFNHIFGGSQQELFREIEELFSSLQHPSGLGGFSGFSGFGGLPHGSGHHNSYNNSSGNGNGGHGGLSLRDQILIKGSNSSGSNSGGSSDLADGRLTMSSSAAAELPLPLTAPAAPTHTPALRPALGRLHLAAPRITTSDLHRAAFGHERMHPLGQLQPAAMAGRSDAADYEVTRVGSALTSSVGLVMSVFGGLARWLGFGGSSSDSGSSGQSLVAPPLPAPNASEPSATSPSSPVTSSSSSTLSSTPPPRGSFQIVSESQSMVQRPDGSVEITTTRRDSSGKTTVERRRRWRGPDGKIQESVDVDVS